MRGLETGRLAMVQTLDQYEMIYEIAAVFEESTERPKEEQTSPVSPISINGDDCRIM